MNARAALSEALRGPRLLADAARAARAGDAAGARRRLAVLAGHAARGPHDPARGAALLRDALDAALVGAQEPVRVVGRRAVAPRPLSERARTVVLSGALELAGPDLLDGLDADLVVAHLPLWPDARRELPDEPIRLLRSRAWWLARFAERGWQPAVEFRAAQDGLSCLVLRRPRPAAAAARAPAADPALPRVRVVDDLSEGGSFAWITTSIALALRDLRVPVSVAPTALAPSIERADEVAALIGPSAGRADAELGWTHFWPRYQRPLGGRLPLPLFAINYEFEDARIADHDPWLRGLIEADTPLAPISTFCRDVLAHAGAAPERLHVVPMGHTDGLVTEERVPLPNARALKLLHVTNVADVERNGTPLALAGFTRAFTPRDDVTLVLRDYGGASAELAAQAARLRGRGYDVRYWPVFLASDRLGALTGAFDALLAPFRGEGFGIKLLDAMACALPVIGPLYGGPRDFLDGTVAFPVHHELVPVAQGYDAQRLTLGNRPRWAQCDVDDLARALREVADDLPGARRRGEAARERVLSRFTWRHTAERIVEILR